MVGCRHSNHNHVNENTNGYEKNSSHDASGIGRLRFPAGIIALVHLFSLRSLSFPRIIRRSKPKFNPWVAWLLGPSGAVRVDSGPSWARGRGHPERERAALPDFPFSLSLWYSLNSQEGIVWRK